MGFGFIFILFSLSFTDLLIIEFSLFLYNNIYFLRFISAATVKVGVFECHNQVGYNFGFLFLHLYSRHRQDHQVGYVFWYWMDSMSGWSEGVFVIRRILLGIDDVCCSIFYQPVYWGICLLDLWLLLCVRFQMKFLYVCLKKLLI